MLLYDLRRFSASVHDENYTHTRKRKHARARTHANTHTPVAISAQRIIHVPTHKDANTIHPLSLFPPSLVLFLSFLLQLVMILVMLLLLLPLLNEHICHLLVVGAVSEACEQVRELE